MNSGNNKFKSRLVQASIAASTVLCVPNLAFASSEEGGSAGIAAILPNMLEFIPMLIAFLILLFVLAKFGWPKLEGMIAKRDEAIKDSLEKSEQARIESEKVLEQYKRDLADSKKQAASIIADAKAVSENIKAEITNEAKAQAQEIIEKARIAIEQEKKNAIVQLQNSAADTAVALASRIIADDLSEEQHRATIKRYLDEAGSFNAK